MDTEHSPRKPIVITPGKILTLAEMDQLVEELKELQKRIDQENAEIHLNRNKTT